MRMTRSDGIGQPQIAPGAHLVAARRRRSSNPTTRDQADDSGDEQRRAMRPGERREAAKPRAGETE
jgi:hypothetical protein